MTPETLSPGFTDPVTDAQSCFRAVLDAMARPGRIHTAGGVVPPSPLSASAAAVLLTLADHETPLWLDPDAEAARAWVAFHTGAPTAPLGRAMFVMALALPDLSEPSDGTDEMPEIAATVILQVPSLTTGRRFVLAGPGLREPRLLTIGGVPADFAAIWQCNHAKFPRGVDLILCAGNQLTALPRSVSIQDA
jgi:alpha-D-ribose 1-methylphosphonate 5-triphosphate synthase subunit PhnH